ncbi:MAG: AglZ/HisF2 family acetamidino modification protein [Bacteroidota bacterium]
MIYTRIIPCLLLRDEALVKTAKFRNPGYIGDPVNTCRIFNELEVDELTFLDITASRENRGPNFRILQEIANECFMPLSYGGGITALEQVARVLSTGFEKVVLNTSLFSNPGLVSDIAARFGSQSVIVSIDVKKSLLGKYEVFSTSGTKNQKKNPVDWAKQAQELGAGEILLTSIDREGSWKGFDTELIKKVTSSVSIPVIAHGGAGKPGDIIDAVKLGDASAVALGSMVVYQAQEMGVLINFPDRSNFDGII